MYFCLYVDLLQVYQNFFLVTNVNRKIVIMQFNILMM